MMIPSGYYLLLHDAEFEHFQVLRFDDRLTERYYLATICCAEHGCPVDAGAIVVDLATLAERHVEYGPRGMVFEDFAALRRYLGDVEDEDDTPVEEASPPGPAVH